MQIADPTHNEMAIDVNVGDAIVLKPGARVRVLLDSDPLFARQESFQVPYQSRNTISPCAPLYLQPTLISPIFSCI